MIGYNNLKLNGEDVQYMYINSRKAYSLLEDSVPTVNSAAKTILDNATFVKDDTYDGTSFKVWNTYQHQFCKSGAGNTNPWYLTPHIMVSANHYDSSKPVGSYTLQDGTVVNRLAWNNLHDWAEAHGGISKYPYINYSGDIDLITLDKSTAIPDDYLPYVIDYKTLKKYFLKDNFDGMVAFKTSQRHGYGVPVVMEYMSDWHNIYNNQKCPEDMQSRVEEMGYNTPSYNGDSGRPIYMIFDNKPVVISQFRSIVQGPALPLCMDMIRDFVIDYEGSNLLKEIA